MRRYLSSVVIVAVAALGLVAVPVADRQAEAWKPPTHMFGVEDALGDVADGVMGITDLDGATTNVGANAVIRQAVTQFPKAYRAGAVGPDAFPDLLHGQSQIHPDTATENDTTAPKGGRTAQTFEWLGHLWERAWDPSTPEPQRLENIAFALGYMGGHANGDVWAHTWVNEYAGGVFPDFTNLAESDISVRHLIVEGYVDKHRPGYEQQQAYELDAPAKFVADELIFSDFSRNKSSSPVYDLFLGLQDGLKSQEASFQRDNTTQDLLCGDVFGAEVCVPDPTDSPFNVVEWGIDLLIEEYLEHWIDDITTGLYEWVDVWETIAQELFAGKKPSADVVMDHIKQWVLVNLLSMMGLPDFVGEGLYLISEVVSFVVELITDVLKAVFDAAKQVPVLGELLLFLEDKYGDVQNFIGGVVDHVAGLFITSALGFTDLNPATKDAIDRNDDGIITPREVIRVISDPEDYIEDPALFTAGTRAKIDADMGLPAGTDDDAGEVFRDYSPTTFNALRNTTTMARMAMLDEAGLNSLFTQTVGGNTAALNPLYGAHSNLSGGWSVPNNVMLGWAKSIDAEYQWRTNSPNDGHSYGTGALRLFEDCLSRDRVFRTHYAQPVAEHDGYADAGDPPTGITDSQAPVSTLTLDGPNVSNSGQTFVSGETQIAITSTDNYFAKPDLRVSVRDFATGATPPAYGSPVSADPAAFTLDGADGSQTVQFFAVDDSGRCNREDEQTELFMLDNTPPVITVLSPAPPDADYLSDAILPLNFTADDGPGSGVDAATAKHYADGVQQPGPPGSVDLFDYPAGTHLYRAEQADLLGNLGSTEVPWQTVVTHDSLQNNLLKAFAERSCIADFPTYHSLNVKLSNAEAADDRGNDGASDQQLESFKNEIHKRQGDLAEPGKTITTYCANILTINATALQAA